MIVPSLASLLVLAFALSLDGFGVGMMYGLRKIKIGWSAIAIISFFSGMVIYTSMGIGAALSQVIAPAWASRIGAVILIGIGIWALVQFFRQRRETDEEERANDCAEAEGEVGPHTVKQILRLELRRFGLVIQILRTPAVADVDKSGTISPSEAVLLGFALSLDAFGAGIGAALIGLNPLLTAAVVAAASGCFIGFGLKFGLRFADLSWLKKLSALPGCVLIAMGLFKLLQ